MIDEFLKNEKEFALTNCKSLYQNLKLPCTETTMCWGWEFGTGWNEVVKELSTRLETLNLMFRPKFGVHVVMDQCKEKYGMLTCYFHVDIDQPWYTRIWKAPFEVAYRRLSKCDFKFAFIVDCKEYSSDEVAALDDKDVEDAKNRYKNVSNVKIEKKDGKWVKTTKVFHPLKSHREPTRLKPLYWLMNKMRRISLMLSFYVEPSARQLVVRDAVEQMAREHVKAAEKRCFDTCEDCGTQIGTEYSKRVQTGGWINYICEKCDIKRNIHYGIKTIDYCVYKGKKLSKRDKDAVEKIRMDMATKKLNFTDEYKEMYSIINRIIEKLSKNGNNR